LALLAGVDLVAREFARSQLQAVATDAALAGVRALRNNSGMSEAPRREAAVAASRAVAEKIGGAHVSVTASVAPIYVAVELADAPGWLGHIDGSFDVIGRAGYAAPSGIEGTESAGVQQTRLQPNNEVAER
jgi:hypothetical protein